METRAATKPTPRSGELLAIFREASREYAALPQTICIYVVGSAALGVCDGHSDVDSTVLLREKMTQEFVDREKARAIAEGGGFYGGDAENGFALYRVVEGVKLDFGFGTAEQTESYFDDVLLKHDCDELDKQLIIDGIRRGIVVHGDDAKWREWVARSDEYPEALARKMVETHLRVTPPWVMRGMGADRGDVLFLVECFLEQQKRLLAVLYGLNRLYHPGKLKGGPRRRDAFKIAPRALFDRFESVYRDRDLHAAVDEMEALTLETIELVERHMPDVDTAKARQRLAMNNANLPELKAPSGGGGAPPMRAAAKPE
jgi:hypothetical protein